MKNKVLGIWNYLLAGFLGFWNLAFMSTSGLIYKNASSWGGIMRSSAEMYDLLTFNFNAAISAATVFQIFMIILSVAMLIMALVQVMKLHGAKITLLDKLFEKTIKIKKDFDIVTLLVFAYILFSLLTMICFIIGGSQASVIIDANNYTKVRVGFGPVWLFLSGIVIAAKIVFKDKVLLIMDKVLNKDAKPAQEKETKPVPQKTEQKPAEKATAKKQKPAEKTAPKEMPKEENSKNDSSKKKEQKPAEKATAKEQKPTEKTASKEDNK